MYSSNGAGPVPPVSAYARCVGGQRQRRPDPAVLDDPGEPAAQPGHQPADRPVRRPPGRQRAEPAQRVHQQRVDRHPAPVHGQLGPAVRGRVRLGHQQPEREPHRQPAPPALGHQQLGHAAAIGQPGRPDEPEVPAQRLRQQEEPQRRHGPDQVAQRGRQRRPLVQQRQPERVHRRDPVAGAGPAHPPAAGYQQVEPARTAVPRCRAAGHVVHRSPAAAPLQRAPPGPHRPPPDRGQPQLQRRVAEVVVVEAPPRPVARVRQAVPDQPIEQLGVDPVVRAGHPGRDREPAQPVRDLADPRHRRGDPVPVGLDRDRRLSGRHGSPCTARRASAPAGRRRRAGSSRGPAPARWPAR